MRLVPAHRYRVLGRRLQGAHSSLHAWRPAARGSIHQQRRFRNGLHDGVPQVLRRHRRSSHLQALRGAAVASRRRSRPSCSYQRRGRQRGIQVLQRREQPLHAHGGQVRRTDARPPHKGRPHVDAVSGRTLRACPRGRCRMFVRWKGPAMREIEVARAEDARRSFYERNEP